MVPSPQVGPSPGWYHPPVIPSSWWSIFLGAGIPRSAEIADPSSGWLEVGGFRNNSLFPHLAPALVLPLTPWALDEAVKSWRVACVYGQGNCYEDAGLPPLCFFKGSSQCRCWLWGPGRPQQAVAGCRCRRNSVILSNRESMCRRQAWGKAQRVNGHTQYRPVSQI